MVPGEVGGLGPSVLRLVVEELKLGGESVMTELMVVETARVITLNRDSATLSPALRQVKIRFSTSFLRSIFVCFHIPP